jgi:hypothetical protein
MASYNSVSSGNGCPECSRRVPKSSLDFHSLAGMRGFTWIGPMEVNTSTKTLWRCQNGHEWQATYSSILGGSGCPSCSGKKRKTADDFRRLAKEKGIRWIGPEVPNNKCETEWECPEGHRCYASYNTIQSSINTGCLECSGLSLKTPADYRSLAAERGFEWLGPEVSSSQLGTYWKCGKGHIWEAAYSTIKRGHGCGSCLDWVNGAAVSKPQRSLWEMIGGELNGARVGRFVIWPAPQNLVQS